MQENINGEKNMLVFRNVFIISDLGIEALYWPSFLDKLEPISDLNSVKSIIL